MGMGDGGGSLGRGKLGSEVSSYRVGVLLMRLGAFWGNWGWGFENGVGVGVLEN